MPEYIGRAPFFIEGIDSDGLSHIVGHCDDGGKVGRIMEVMCDLLDIFHGIQVHPDDDTEEKRQDAKIKAYRLLQQFDRRLSQNTRYYQVVGLKNFDTDLSDELQEMIDRK